MVQNFSCLQITRGLCFQVCRKWKNTAVQGQIECVLISAWLCLLLSHQGLMHMLNLSRGNLYRFLATQIFFMVDILLNTFRPLLPLIVGDHIYV